MLISNLLATANRTDFLNLGFTSFIEKSNPREQNFKLRIDDVTLYVNTLRQVKATIDNEKVTVPLIADTIEELEDWIEFITAMKK